ncbi:MAG: GNAT family protein [Saprospiraceae bacterium]|nr:GNAT family protein [Saprospiraceae bacterium]
MKIILRELAIQDLEHLSTLANNIKIWNNVRDSMPHPYTMQEANFFIELLQKEDPKTTFAITCNGLFCGMIGLHQQNDVYRKSAELGYWIGEPYWGKGVASEAVRQITDFGFTELDLERIFAGVFEYNLGSMRVLEKNNFKHEGIARKAVFKNDQFYDEHKFSKLKSEV